MRRCAEANKMDKIGLLPNPEKDPKLYYSDRICELLVGCGATVYTCPEFPLAPSSGVVSVPRADIFSLADCVITLGGDGTLLRIAHEAARHKKPIMGINFGKIGYMAELEFNEIEMLSRLLTGEFAIEKRIMLDVRVIREGRTVFKSIALNDAVISKGVIARLIDLHVTSNGGRVSDYRADGVILSTPTGSTGYSMSAGGPILEPDMEAIILAPVCPHSLVARPIVFSENTEIEVQVRNLADKDTYLTIDGFETLRLRNGDTVAVRRARNVTRLIKLKNLNFYKILNQKLAADGEEFI